MGEDDNRETQKHFTPALESQNLPNDGTQSGLNVLSPPCRTIGSSMQTKGMSWCWRGGSKICEIRSYIES